MLALAERQDLKKRRQGSKKEDETMIYKKIRGQGVKKEEEKRQRVLLKLGTVVSFRRTVISAS
jgi:hypothetical protein